MPPSGRRNIAAERWHLVSCSYSWSASMECRAGPAECWSAPFLNAGCFEMERCAGSACTLEFGCAILGDRKDFFVNAAIIQKPLILTLNVFVWVTWHIQPGSQDEHLHLIRVQSRVFLEIMSACIPIFVQDHYSYGMNQSCFVFLYMSLLFVFVVHDSWFFQWTRHGCCK